MEINYDILLSDEKDFEFDKELLTEFEYKDILFIISNEIAKYREENRLNQEELAEKLDITQAMVSKIESGKYNHTIKSLVNIWNRLSDSRNNFGANLLKKIYDKVVKNYSVIRIKMENDIVKTKEEFEFNKKSKTISFFVDVEDNNINTNIHLEKAC